MQTKNTELWRGNDADCVFVTEGGCIGLDVGGCVMVKLPKLWHEEVSRREQAEEELECAHMSLDKLDAPRERDGKKLSIVGRIYAAVGHAPSHPMFDAKVCKRCNNSGWLPEIEGSDGSYVTIRPCKCEAGDRASRLF